MAKRNACQVARDDDDMEARAAVRERHSSADIAPQDDSRRKPQPGEAATGADPEGPQSAPMSPSSKRGLDWLVFFVADVQTGFGPFVAVFLTTQKWTQVDIGVVLTIGGLVSLIGQIPLGALVDQIRRLRIAIAVTLAVIAVCALAFAIWPIFPVVVVSRVAHAAASCVLGLAIVSLSVRLARSDQISGRLGRNAAFASAGTGIAASVMGVIGYYLSSQSVFFLAAAMVAPALIALSRIRPEEICAPTAPVRPAEGGDGRAAGLAQLFRSRPLIILAACVTLFHLANAAMLPLAASILTMRSAEAATAMVAAALVVPQFTVVLLSTQVGRFAQRWGRRPLLIIGFAALAIRGVLFATTSDPQALVAIQVLDGISAAVLGVIVPLVIVDVAHASGHFNLAQGAVGCAMGLGASVSTTLSGYVADNFGSYTAFGMLAAIAGAGLLTVLVAMPETRPRSS